MDTLNSARSFLTLDGVPFPRISIFSKSLSIELGICRTGRLRGVVYVDRNVFGDCARTVYESNVLRLFGLVLSEKQIPRFVGNIVS